MNALRVSYSKMNTWSVSIEGIGPIGRSGRARSSQCLTGSRGLRKWPTANSAIWFQSTRQKGRVFKLRSGCDTASHFDQTNPTQYSCLNQNFGSFRSICMIFGTRRIKHLPLQLCTKMTTFDCMLIVQSLIKIKNRPFLPTQKNSHSVDQSKRHALVKNWNASLLA